MSCYLDDWLNIKIQLRVFKNQTCDIAIFFWIRKQTKLFILWENLLLCHYILHCVKSICIRSFSGPYFLAFGLYTKGYWIRKNDWIRKNVKNFVLYLHLKVTGSPSFVQKHLRILQRKHYLNYYLWKPPICRKDFRILGDYLGSNLHRNGRAGQLLKNCWWGIILTRIPVLFYC